MLKSRLALIFTHSAFVGVMCLNQKLILTHSTTPKKPCLSMSGVSVFFRVFLPLTEEKRSIYWTFKMFGNIRYA